MSFDIDIHVSIQGVPFFAFIVGNASIKLLCFLYIQGFYILTVGRTNRLASLVLTDLTYCLACRTVYCLTYHIPSVLVPL